MNRLGIMFILIALIISGLFTALVYRQQGKKPKVAEQPANVEVLVATKSLNLGVQLKDTDVAWKTWPRYAVTSEFIIQGTRKKEDVIGAVVRKPITVGQAITDSMVVAKANLSPLSGILQSGMRAVTVNVTLASSLGGLITPGDIVDVILTYSRQAGGSNKEFITNTILRRISVLAVDQEITPAQAGAKPAGKMSGMNANTRNVTLQVTPFQAEILAKGQAMGTLTLSLTSPASGVEVDPQQVAPAPKEEKSELILFHGEKVVKTMETK